MQYYRLIDKNVAYSIQKILSGHQQLFHMATDHILFHLKPMLKLFKPPNLSPLEPSPAIMASFRFGDTCPEYLASLAEGLSLDHRGAPVSDFFDASESGKILAALQQHRDRPLERSARDVAEIHWDQTISATIRILGEARVVEGDLDRLTQPLFAKGRPGGNPRKVRQVKWLVAQSRQPWLSNRVRDIYISRESFERHFGPSALGFCLKLIQSVYLCDNIPLIDHGFSPKKGSRLYFIQVFTSGCTN